MRPRLAPLARPAAAIPTVWLSCQMPRPARRQSCRPACEMSAAPAQSGTDNAPPTPAASDTETPTHRSGAASGHAPPNGSPRSAECPRPWPIPLPASRQTKPPQSTPAPLSQQCHPNRASQHRLAPKPARHNDPTVRHGPARQSRAQRPQRPHAGLSDLPQRRIKSPGHAPRNATPPPQRYHRSLTLCQERSAYLPWSAVD